MVAVDASAGGGGAGGGEPPGGGGQGPGGGGGGLGGEGPGGGEVGGSGGAGGGAPDLDGDGYTADVDCDDDKAWVNPGAQESCDNVDGNCDGIVDTDLMKTVYVDQDKDGFGTTPVQGCEVIGYADRDGDCDDTSAYTNPWASEKLDDGRDNDCDPNTPDHYPDDSGFGPVPSAVSGVLLAGWMGLSAWRRRRRS